MGVLQSGWQESWIESIMHTKCATYKSLRAWMCLHTPDSTWVSSSKLLQHDCHPPNSLTQPSQTAKKLLQWSSCMLTVILNFGNCKGGREMCLVQLLLVTGCSLSGSRHGCHCGSVLCCCVCVRKAFSSEPCDSEDVWGALRCPRSRNTATATMRPANYAFSMQMSCRERKTDTGKERKRASERVH